VALRQSLLGSFNLVLTRLAHELQGCFGYPDHTSHSNRIAR
jgi:hypothetical protein